MNIKFGQVLHRKEEVESTLRRAQFAVLNPEVDHTKILAAPVEDLQNLATRPGRDFSRDVICVELKGPDLTDLSFIDLPGVFLSFTLILQVFTVLFRNHSKCSG